MLSDILVALVIGFVVVTLTAAFLRLSRDGDARRDYTATLRAVRWWMWPAALAHIVVLVVSIVGLVSAVPVLGFGWWQLLGGSGNIALGQTGRDGQWWNLLALCIPIALMVLVPYLAIQEEYVFRYASEDDSRWVRLRRQALFGIGHAVVMGVPVAAGFVLIGSGLLYELLYFRSLNQRLARTELVSLTTLPVQHEYPTRPTGPYDPAAWDAHHAEVDRVIEENQRLRELWRQELEEQGEQRAAQVDELRAAACANAAAFHCCTNWLIIGALIAWLLAV
ncbi:hypothetical protein O6072_18395 [Mycolicibacterium neoaurum]|uniref:hypothetical protein n=1 Tax=Mycolicibacterium neoaurum TaxID=1795 RepID=UPI00248C7AE0|nr:hypothetical protein [Mycolicibacterium neoaurum]WBP93208.1 hypothetical protein O7W24_18850 [Mycolicibacterium neoaurum]WBS06825.1 hypothetical protein O6072_18395 [Mycolicibacterium neoaurum]